jgi:hypothetical protein
MVAMSDADQERWPALCEFAKNLKQLVLSPSKRRVFEAFKKHSRLHHRGSSLDPLSVMTPLTWRQGPQLQIHPFPCDMVGEQLQKRMGLTVSRRVVIIAQDVVWHFQQRPSDPRLRLMVEATILHELCHWGAEFVREVPTKPEDEIGEDFETAAYGRIIPRLWAACPTA